MRLYIYRHGAVGPFECTETQEIGYLMLASFGAVSFHRLDYDPRCSGVFCPAHPLSSSFVFSSSVPSHTVAQISAVDWCTLQRIDHISTTRFIKKLLLS